MQYQINQIDHDLIQFLGHKIDALTKSISSELENSNDFTDLLAQANISNRGWQNLISSCTQSFDSQAIASTDLQQRQVTIVGGRGRMGRFFSSCLSQVGHQVNILEHNDWGQAEKLLTDIDLVLLCVPIESMLKTIGRLSQYLSPHTALADISSIKAPIVKAMLEYHQGPVMGLHPMFGPGIESFLSQKVVICPGRQDQSFQWFLKLIQNDGGELVLATPQEHDLMMTTVQAIRHFATFSFGAFLCQENIDIERSLDFSSPKYRQQIEMVQRLVVQSAPLVVDIMLATPESRERIFRLGNTCSRLAKLIQQGDRDALINEFQITHNFFQR